MTRRVFLALGVFACLAASGCGTTSLHPLVAPGEAERDDGLVGTWRVHDTAFERDTDTTWTIESPAKSS